jgi:hypothetical protein
MEMKKPQTVGQLIEMLAKHSFNTPINSTCRACCKGEVNGDMEIVTIEDRTNQTYGYIDIHFNRSWENKQG